jgi:hypothetical protein
VTRPSSRLLVRKKGAGHDWLGRTTANVESAADSRCQCHHACDLFVRLKQRLFQNYRVFTCHRQAKFYRTRSAHSGRKVHHK